MTVLKKGKYTIVVITRLYNTIYNMIKYLNIINCIIMILKYNTIIILKYTQTHTHICIYIYMYMKE